MTPPNEARPGDALTHEELTHRLDAPNIHERLVVTPLLDPTDAIGVASVDVRLGNQFIVMKRVSFPLVDVGDESFVSGAPDGYQERVVKSIGQAFVLHPGQLVLGSTLEYVQIPPGLLCYVTGKSTWGRLGLIIATATKVDPGFKGCITLEIVNEGEVPILLYPGLPIAQLVLHHAAGERTYEGRYEAPIGPQFPKFRRTIDMARYWLVTTTK